MVIKLKAECGYQFTSKLKGMLNDMTISRDIREAYKTYKRSDTDPMSLLGLYSLITSIVFPMLTHHSSNKAYLRSQKNPKLL